MVKNKGMGDILQQLSSFVVTVKMGFLRCGKDPVRAGAWPEESGDNMVVVAREDRWFEREVKDHH